MNSAGRVRVGEDPADGARDEKHVLGAVRPEPVVDGGLVAQIELLTGRAENVREAGGSFNRRAIADPTRPRCPAMYTRASRGISCAATARVYQAAKTGAR